MARRAEQQGKAWIVPESERLRVLAELCVKFVQAVAKNEPVPITRATVDHDATVIEAHKKEARAHDKGGRGYQPSLAMWAETGLVLADEFRDGNVPAGMNNLPLIERAFAVLPASVTERFFRADSACYDEKVLKWLAEPSRQIGFAISADMTNGAKAASHMPERSSLSRLVVAQDPCRRITRVGPGFRSIVGSWILRACTSTSCSRTRPSSRPSSKKAGSPLRRDRSACRNRP